MQEILNNRSYNAKHFLKDDGKKVLQAHAGHIHYKGTDGEFKDVDFALEDMGAYWQMVKASYKLLIAKDFGANKLIKFQNKYRGANHEIIYEPRMLAWVNKTDLSDFQVFRNQQSVTGYITGENNNIIRYDNAFGNGLHFEITLLRSGFKKEIVIEAKNKLELPPTANHKLVALFEYSGTGLKVKSNDKLRQWTSGNYFEEQDGFRVQEEANEVYQSFIRPAYIIDDGAEQPTQELIKVFWKQHNGKLYQAKVLPKAFLQSASYPVRADTTTSYYAGPQDGSVFSSGTVWSTVRGATTGSLYAGQIKTIASVWKSGATYYCRRSFFPYDTSAIPDTDTIESATAYFTVKNEFYGTGDAYAVLVEGTQEDTLAAGDFDAIGSTDLGSSQPSITTAGGISIALNSSGLALISKTGLTKFAILEKEDFSNTTPTKSIESYLYASEQTGTSEDPYLEVTYGEGGGGSTWTPKIIMY
jgi:hypothetical protein